MALCCSQLFLQSAVTELEIVQKTHILTKIPDNNHSPLHRFTETGLSKVFEFMLLMPERVYCEPQRSVYVVCPFWLASQKLLKEITNE